jgi:hypothetical protein
MLEHRYFSESSVPDLDHRLRQKFNIALDLTKLNTSKQHLIKFIFNESLGYIIDHKGETWLMNFKALSIDKIKERWFSLF